MKSVKKEPVVKRCLLILDIQGLKSDKLSGDDQIFWV